MTPTDFSFSLTVPRDVQLAGMVRDLAAHAVSYAKLDADVGQAFLARVSEVSSRRLAASAAGGCVVIVSGDAAGLYVTVDGETVRSS
jgi:hypothetical protein